VILHSLPVGFYFNSQAINPIPQVYSESSTGHPNGWNTENWYRIGIYSYIDHSNSFMPFRGEMTQQGACQYNASLYNTTPQQEYNGSYASSQDSLNHLSDLLNSDARTSTAELH
jgi:hypothetical protein